MEAFLWPLCLGFQGSIDLSVFIGNNFVEITSHRCHHVRGRQYDFGLHETLFSEALLGVIGIRDIRVKNYGDTGYLGGKLKGYGIF